MFSIEILYHAFLLLFFVLPSLFEPDKPYFTMVYDLIFEMTRLVLPLCVKARGFHSLQRAQAVRPQYKSNNISFFCLWTIRHKTLVLDCYSPFLGSIYCFNVLKKAFYFVELFQHLRKKDLTQSWYLFYFCIF